MSPTVELLKELIRQRSVLGTEGEIASFIYHLIEPYSSEIYYQDLGDGRKNVIAFGSGKKERCILLNAHMDTVEVMKNWSVDPFAGVEADGKIFGLGACDMKAGLAIFLLLFAEFSEKLNIIFTACADEEGESLGAFQLINHLKEKGISPDLVLISEPTNERLMMGARGRVVFKIEVYGRSAHGARPNLGINAVVDCGRIAGIFEDMPVGEHEKLGRGSFCPLLISGQSDSLSVPEFCKLVVDRHYVLGEKPEVIKREIENRILALGLRSKVNVGYVKRSVPFLKPYVTHENNLVEEFMKTVNAEITYGQSVGDFNLFGENWPTVVYGVAGGNWHAADEFVYADSLARVEKKYREFFERML
ncbi:MAG: M20 family metallopeptidase [Thermoplasmata archaeon]